MFYCGKTSGVFLPFGTIIFALVIFYFADNIWKKFIEKLGTVLTEAQVNWILNKIKLSYNNNKMTW